MNETTYYEYRDLILSATDTVNSQFTFYVSLVSAFLVVAYLVGKKLTRIQVAVLTIIYSVMMWQSIGAIMITLDQYFVLLRQFVDAYPEAVRPDISVSDSDRWLTFTSLLAGFLMSLLFMWMVRRRKTV